MLEKQVKQIVKRIAVNDSIMENMFCAPKGALGRIGGQLMSQDHWLPGWVLELLEINPSDSVLEVGSGLGLGLQLAAARAHQGRVVGVDLSDTMLEMARRRNRGQEEAFKWYLELRKYGSIPHSGFGMGVERVVAWLCSIEHIREALPFPRTIKRGYP